MFGDQLFYFYKEILRGFSFSDEFSVCAGSFAVLEKCLEKHTSMQTNLVIITFWSGKIFSFYYNPSKNESCGYCLVHAIRRNLNVNGPDYVSIIDGDTMLSNSFVFPPDVLINALLITFQYIVNGVEEFIQGSKVLVLSLVSDSITNEFLNVEPECKKCNSTLYENMPLCDEKYNFVKNPHSPTRNYSIEYFDKILNKFCSPSVGFVKDISYDLQLPVASCTAKLILNKIKNEMTLGRSHSFGQSRSIAIIEALERLAGMRGGLNKTIIKSSYSNLEKNAINPNDFCLHFDQQYFLEDFPFEKFDPHHELTWVSGIRLNSNQEVWVPISMAFYGFKYNNEHKMYAFESSNGCAIGSSYTEAIISGLLEVIERDSFLLAWYQKKSLTDITDYILGFEKIKDMYDKIRFFCNVDIYFYDSTAEHNVPSIFALAVCDRKDSPNFSAASGSGITYYDAAKSALYELSCHHVRLKYILSQIDMKEKAMIMLEDSFKVKTMVDHGLVNALPEAYTRFEFLLNSKNKYNKENLSKFELLGVKDPSETLNNLVDRLNRCNLDIVVVDQTPIYMKKINLFCVKVLVSDMLPITFGHIYSRINSKRIILNLKHPINFSSLHPHPFP